MIHKIRGLNNAPRAALASKEARDYARYASNRLLQMMPELDDSTEGEAFWRDVQQRLAQIHANGELQ